MCVACIRDSGGDWDAFDTLLAERRTSTFGHPDERWESLWSHLLDLRKRLAEAGLDADSLARLAPTGTVTRARAQLYKRSVQQRDLTDPMRLTPRVRLTRRALKGAWPAFPVSPETAGRQLAYTVGETDRWWDERATWTLAEDFHSAVTSLLKAADGPAAQLAVLRAALTHAYELAESIDDSSGMFGHTATELVDAYARLDWRASGLPAETYWRDLLQILCLLSNYAMVPSPESALLRIAGVQQDIALAEAVAVELTADYQQARMGWHADEMGTLRAHLAVAGCGVTVFADLAQQLGSHNLIAIRALVDAAFKRRSPTTALAVLRTADVPGRHQAWIHRRRIELETEQEP
jgi:hypothetical protein